VECPAVIVVVEEEEEEEDKEEEEEEEEEDDDDDEEEEEEETEEEEEEEEDLFFETAVEGVAWINFVLSLLGAFFGLDDDEAGAEEDEEEEEEEREDDDEDEEDVDDDDLRGGGGMRFFSGDCSIRISLRFTSNCTPVSSNSTRILSSETTLRTVATRYSLPHLQNLLSPTVSSVLTFPLF
jgi:hypothetical protein